MYRDELARQGKNPVDYEVAAGYAWLHVSENPEKRWKEAVEHLAYQQNEYGKWFKAAGMDFIKSVEATKASVEKNDCYIVNPDQAIEMIKKYVDATGSNRFYTCCATWFKPSLVDEHIELMSTKVIRNLKIKS